MYRLIEKLHLERYLNSRLILAIDLVVSGVASLCALVLVRLLLPPLSNISKFALLWIGCAVVYSFITFFLLKTYRSVIRHSTLREIAKFVVAVIGKELLLGLTILLYPPTPLGSGAVRMPASMADCCVCSPAWHRFDGCCWLCCCSICC